MGSVKKAKFKPLPSYARVRELFDYDPLSGVLSWRVSTNNRVGAGDKVGCRNAAGHWVGHIDGSVYVLHRIIWLWMTGEEPADEVDHKNGASGDNRWENLRVASSTQNSGNMRLSKRNKSGWKGITRAVGCDRWHVKITKDGQQYYLGLFKELEDAKAAYRDKAHELFGEFARAA